MPARDMIAAITFLFNTFLAVFAFSFTDVEVAAINILSFLYISVLAFLFVKIVM